MSWRRFSASGFLLGTFALAGAGCFSQPVLVRRPVSPSPPVFVSPPDESRPVSAPAVETPPPPAPTAVGKDAEVRIGIDHVGRRLAVYEEELSRWRTVTDRLMAEDVSGAKSLPGGWYDCQQRLETLSEDYSRLQRRIIAGSGDDVEAIDPWVLVEEDFAYQGSGCGDMFREQFAKPVPGKAPLGNIESRGCKVLEAVRRGKYQEALAAYDGLVQGSTGPAVGADVRQAYVMALLRTNRIDAALAELEKILAEYGDFDSWKLRQQLADLQLATGKHAQAVKGYGALVAAADARQKDKEWVREQFALLTSADGRRVEELNSYAAALRSSLTFDGKRVPGELKMWVARLEYSYPGSSFAVKARQLLSQVEGEARAWVSDRLLEVDALVDAHQYAKALANLEDLAGQDLPAEMVEVVRKAMDDVVIVAAQGQDEQRSHNDQILQERWREAGHLFDSERFDEAIVVYSSLFGTTEDVRAREKIGEAAALAAAKMRREGAALFFKAGRTADPAQKKELLLRSRQLLQAILEKYPYVELAEKVAGNLQNIDAQLRAVDAAPGKGGANNGAPVGQPESDGGSDHLSW